MRTISSHKTGTPFNPETVHELLSFLLTTKSDDVLYYAKKREGVNSAYSETEIKTGLDRIIRYAFNPLIPSQVFRPSSVRHSSWRTIESNEKNITQLPSSLTDRSEPVITRGIEHEVTTPDLNTGGYYEYQIERTGILMKHEGHNVFISLNRQDDKSEVGKKGGVIDSDDKWNYFYSGEEGLSKTGLGWVDSYIYSSLSLAIYYEVDAKKPLVKYGIFKWLSAGWAGINVVKSKHIRTGLNRYSRDLKIMIENQGLPDVKEMVNHFSILKNLSVNELKSRYGPYLANITSKYENDKVFSRRSFSKLIKSGKYLEQMSRKELEGALVLEEMKCLTGNNCNSAEFKVEK